MKECADFYIILLTHIINLSISQGHFPSELKLTKVIPIYKSGDKQIIENYRPISVLPFFSKFFYMNILYYMPINMDLEEVTLLVTQ